MEPNLPTGVLLNSQTGEIMGIGVDAVEWNGVIQLLRSGSVSSTNLSISIVHPPVELLEIDDASSTSNSNDGVVFVTLMMTLGAFGLGYFAHSRSTTKLLEVKAPTNLPQVEEEE